MFQVPPHPDSHALGTLVWSLVLGLLAGLVPHAVVEALLVVRERVKLIRGRYDWKMPGVGGLATGVIGAAIFASWESGGYLESGTRSCRLPSLVRWALR